MAAYCVREEIKGTGIKFSPSMPLVPFISFQTFQLNRSTPSAYYTVQIPATIQQPARRSRTPLSSKFRANAVVRPILFATHAIRALAAHPDGPRRRRPTVPLEERAVTRAAIPPRSSASSRSRLSTVSAAERTASRSVSQARDRPNRAAKLCEPTIFAIWILKSATRCDMFTRTPSYSSWM